MGFYMRKPDFITNKYTYKAANLIRVWSAALLHYRANLSFLSTCKFSIFFYFNRTATGLDCWLKIVNGKNNKNWEKNNKNWEKTKIQILFAVSPREAIWMQCQNLCVCVCVCVCGGGGGGGVKLLI